MEAIRHPLHKSLWFARKTHSLEKKLLLTCRGMSTVDVLPTFSNKKILNFDWIWCKARPFPVISTGSSVSIKMALIAQDIYLQKQILYILFFVSSGFSEGLIHIIVNKSYHIFCSKYAPHPTTMFHSHCSPSSCWLACYLSLFFILYICILLFNQTSPRNIVSYKECAAVCIGRLLVPDNWSSSIFRQGQPIYEADWKGHLLQQIRNGVPYSIHSLASIAAAAPAASTFPSWKRRGYGRRNVGKNRVVG